MSSVKLDLSGLEELKKKIATNKKVRVGILGSGNQRDDDLGNAGIGLVQEMGSLNRNIPPRSFYPYPPCDDAKERHYFIN
jgi:hypothetical protein